MKTDEDPSVRDHPQGQGSRSWRTAAARFVGRLAAGEAGVVLMTELRGASNAKAKRELHRRPAHPTRRRGMRAA
ncbi:hypothetical protein [Nonomuraea roseoviolacea]|uniref:hypothetical protein n=1 Tax=Nonomuraea roseoviolacea TaxID=103837 RepID=UPI0031E0F62B